MEVYLDVTAFQGVTHDCKSEVHLLNPTLLNSDNSDLDVRMISMTVTRFLLIIMMTK